MSTQSDKLQLIVEKVQSRYSEVPADISRRLQDVQLSLQNKEEKVPDDLFPSKSSYTFLTPVFTAQLEKKSDPIWKLNRQVAELASSLEKVQVLLEQKSPTVTEAEHLLKVSTVPCLITEPCVN